MKDFRRKLLAIAGVGLLVSIITLTNARRGEAQSPGPNVNIASPLPLPVRAVENEFQPVQAWATCSLPSQGSCAATLYTVPNGKRLVIEYFSAYAGTGSVGESFRAVLFNPAENVPVALPLIPPSIPGAGGITSGGQAVRMYVPANQVVRGNADRSGGSGTSSYFFTIVGHLVNVP